MLPQINNSTAPNTTNKRLFNDHWIKRPIMRVS
jgi:hypothetical protein